MPISCHFQDCEALLFVLTTCKQRYIKYSGFTFTFFTEILKRLRDFLHLLHFIHFQNNNNDEIGIF